MLLGPNPGSIPELIPGRVCVHTKGTPAIFWQFSGTNVQCEWGYGLSALSVATRENIDGLPMFPALVLESVHAFSVSRVSVFPRSQSLPGVAVPSAPPWWSSAPVWWSSALPWWSSTPVWWFSAPPWWAPVPCHNVTNPGHELLFTHHQNFIWWTPLYWDKNLPTAKHTLLLMRRLISTFQIFT